MESTSRENLIAKARAKYVGDEPDYLSFKYKGTKCEIKRNPEMLFLCGYASFRPCHCYDVAHYRNNLESIDVHGGVTYFEVSPGGAITIGFDCAHINDLIPTFSIQAGEKEGEEYRTIDFVKKEIQKMVDQIIKINDQLSVE